MSPRVIAFYLPQFHPTDSNDRWYGKGFTEWTNIGKSKKLFPGHYHPRVPADLGYYDLRLPEVREAQAKMAKNYGVEGFCYYHYWFGNGKMELERPLQEILRLGEPDYPFCLCWANESWARKHWNPDGSNTQDLLVEQTYPGEQDMIDHFHYCLRAFQDPRYIRVDGKPLFMVFRPRKFSDVTKFIRCWRKLAAENGIGDFHFVAQSTNADKDIKEYTEWGFDGVNSLRMNEYRKHWPMLKRLFFRHICRAMRFPRVLSYADIARYFVRPGDEAENMYPSLIPNWDHTPRSGRGGSVWVRCLPRYFGESVRQVCRAVARKKPQHQLIFLKSWNEWGEGNYMEPDLRYGYSYLEELKRALDECGVMNEPQSPENDPEAHRK